MFSDAGPPDPLVQLLRTFGPKRQAKFFETLIARPHPSFEDSVRDGFSQDAAVIGRYDVKISAHSIVLRCGDQVVEYPTARLLRLILKVKPAGRLAAALTIWKLNDPQFVREQISALPARNAAAPKDVAGHEAGPEHRITTLNLPDRDPREAFADAQTDAFAAYGQLTTWQRVRRSSGQILFSAALLLAFVAMRAISSNAHLQEMAGPRVVLWAPLAVGAMAFATTAYNEFMSGQPRPVIYGFNRFYVGFAVGQLYALLA